MSDITISGSLKIQSGYLDTQKQMGIFGIDLDAAYPKTICRTYSLTSTPANIDIGEITSTANVLVLVRNLNDEDEAQTIITYGAKVEHVYIPFGKLYNGEPSMFTSNISNMDGGGLWACAESTANLWICLLQLADQ
jgi:hypothetical protein